MKGIYCNYSEILKKNKKTFADKNNYMFQYINLGQQQILYKSQLNAKTQKEESNYVTHIIS